MNAGLLWMDKISQWEPRKDPVTEDRFRDLRLEPLLSAMSGGRSEVREVCRQILDEPLQTEEEILYRQEIMRDCLQDPGTPEALYDICLEAEEKRKSTWCRLESPHLTTVYSSAQDLLKIYMEALVRIRRTLEGKEFHSQGLKRLSALLQRELSDEYLEDVKKLRAGIESWDGMEISGGFGPYLQGVSYVMRQPDRGLGRLRWLVQPSYTLGERDTKGEKDVQLRQDRAINQVANVMAQAAENLQGLVDQIRKELSFYLGGLQLWRALGLPPERLCFPQFTRDESRCCRGLYDGTLVLEGNSQVMGNTAESRDRQLWLLTGANQGGKTTFLRSLGLCQLMAQSGLFVFAESCRIPIRGQIYTHFGREEDRNLCSGKLDEELGRMSTIADRIRPGDMLLSNESFSSTNDRDGSQILLGIVRALLDRGIEVFTVTHLMDYAQTIVLERDVLSLRPERTEAGERTYRLCREGTKPDAYAEDIYRKIFTEP